jgi:hypothetical protein
MGPPWTHYIIDSLFRPTLQYYWNITLTLIEEQEKEPIENFLYTLKAPETKRQYPRHIVALIINVLEHFSNTYLQYADMSNGFSAAFTTS